MTDLAELLWAARRDGHAVPAANVKEPESDTEAYAIQARISALCEDNIVGYKVGSTSREAQQKLGTSSPGTGVLFRRFVHQSPAVVPICIDHDPQIECEFAVRLGKDLPQRVAEYGFEEVADAVDAVAGAIEVVGTRIAGGLAGKGRKLVAADGGANIALVLGSWLTHWRSLDLAGHRVAAVIDGVQAGSGTGARALGHPLNVLQWLANRQSESGEGLKRGEIISTGTCSGLDPVRPGQTAVADFGSLGRVTVEFTSFQR